MSDEKKKRSESRSRNTKKDDFYDYDNRDSVKPRKKKTADTGVRDTDAGRRITDGMKAEKMKKEPNPSSVGNQLAIVLLVVLSIFIVICFAFSGDVGVVGRWIQAGLFGIFGCGAFLVPFLLFQMAIFWRRDVKSGAVKYKYIVALFTVLFLSVLIHTIWCIGSGVGKMSFADTFRWSQLKEMFNEGVLYHGGGFLGGLIASAFICAVGYPGAIIFSLLFLVGFGMALFGLTPVECFQRYMFYRRRQKGAQRMQKEIQAKKKVERQEARVRAEAARAERAAQMERTRRAAEIDSSIFDDDMDIGVAEEEPASAPAERPAPKGERAPQGAEDVPFGRDATRRDDGSVSEVLYPINVVKSDDKVSLDDIFDKKDDAEVLTKFSGSSDDYEDLTEDLPRKAAQMELRVEKKPVVPARPTSKDSTPAAPVIIPAAPREKAPVASPDVPVVPERPQYVFPPITLLQIETAKQNTDVSSELRENADKIIQTLDSFNVHVKISNVSRGPTITRYEVEPSAGTRVRSIMNLLDDIALSLASSGVRSDGIIAGKSAIGIEVPNKTVNTVYVRELIEDKQFADAKSRLTTSLGMDVSGAPVYLDIAKMPHLLIAGATGMGKSVCINSLLVSLLYKARPDEVKLILIDPKKVELNIYNGIPHLLVPVVFDPKKAAGSLHWAVTEMERRFELIEAQNTRNIAQYNAAIAGDPAKEFLPQIVIIIDELADLMMSAPDDVEASICRLAQKARAAGMHLIIGTQRPSVDVITGLIKANIPSRIAFTVASQIDSRTIIDMQGAEKLIGRGDMLYAPVGSSKPIRVQGSFVSEKEIEEIVGFIKEHAQDCAYSNEVIEQIDKAAELCGQKKGKGAAASAVSDDGGDAEEEDPMLDSAIELAVESGKISTSLIQRRLSLGYGRAAKLIDVMERRGIVSAPEGQKPRAVLISREQYLEMKMNHSDDAAASAEPEDDEPPFDL